MILLPTLVVPHGTSVQAVQPKPYSMKNDPTDFVMFQRKPERQLSEESDNDLYEMPVYPDGSCLFRSVTARIDRCLLLC